MREYSRIYREVTSRLDNFIKEVSIGKGKVCEKFLKDFWSGMLCRQDVLLSEISRGNRKQVLLKKQVERLGRNLNSLIFEQISSSYYNFVRNEINDKTIFCVDNTDIIKPNGKKFEKLSVVRDGSTGRIEKGYEVVDIVALSQNHKQPISLYSHLFSYEEKGYTGNNNETEKALDKLRESFGSIGIKVFDRGYDDIKLMRYLERNEERYVIRCKENRFLTYNGKQVHILDLIQEPTEITQNYYTKGKNNYLLKFRKYAVKLCEIPLNLVVVNGIGKPMLLLTNENSERDLERIITKVYILRWKIEEKFKFSKQVFKIENFRVRKLKAIRNLIMLSSMLCGFIAIICEHQKQKIFKRLLYYSQTIEKGYKKNHIYFYSIARAIADLFQCFKTLKHFSSS